jgi:phosphoenolpyruvate carboxykinase (ATP)
LLGGLKRKDFHLNDRRTNITLIESTRGAARTSPKLPPRWGAGVEYRDLGSVALLEHAIRRGEGQLTESGALVVETGEHTGRSPRDKFVVHDGPMANEMWWGDVNHPMSPEAFSLLHSDIVEYLATGDRYRIDISIGADPEFAMPVRLVTESAWSALFARNLFLPSNGATTDGATGWTIFHAPRFEADPLRHRTFGPTAIAIDFDWRRVLIAGTRYAGEIKKSMFTVMQGILPRQGIATMHCSANEGEDGQAALFFGLSGTGKTTLSTDPARRLIGDDEHGWTDRGIFNFEGGSYAKTIGLSVDREPEIYRATQHFGAVLENVVLDPETRRPFFDDDSLTENTRAAFPLSFLDPAAGGVGAHPTNVVFLSADAFGVLPPLAKLNRDQALFWFLSGYTSKLAGTERGITSPSATFSACFGSPFLPLPPERYAQLFGDRLDAHGSEVWLVNTGWTGGPYGVGQRMPISQTRSVVAAILNGALDSVAFDCDSRFGFMVPRSLPGGSETVLRPRETWQDQAQYDDVALRLARELAANFASFPDVSTAVREAGPSVD